MCRFKPIHGNPRKDSNTIGPSSRIVVVAASFYWSHLGKSFVKIICSNMSVRHNAADLAHKYPLTAKAVDESFYVDDGLTGADSTKEAIEIQKQLQDLFSQGGFLLRKWNSSDPAALQHIPPELKDSQTMHTVTEVEAYTKTLGIEWNTNLDHF